MTPDGGRVAPDAAAAVLLYADGADTPTHHACAGLRDIPVAKGRGEP